MTFLSKLRDIETGRTEHVQRLLLLLRDSVAYVEAQIYAEASKGSIGALAGAVKHVATETAEMVYDVHSLTNCFSNAKL